MRVCAVTGPSGSGKTTLIERLIRKLSGEGLRIAYVKHSHHPFTLSPEGKDTSRALNAGAEEVLYSGEGGTVEFRRRDLSFAEIIDRIDNSDLVLVEGFGSEGMSSIDFVLSLPPGETKGGNGVVLVAENGGDKEEGIFSLNDIEGITRFLVSRDRGPEEGEDS